MLALHHPGADAYRCFELLWGIFKFLLSLSMVWRIVDCCEHVAWSAGNGQLPTARNSQMKRKAGLLHGLVLPKKKPSSGLL